MLNEALPGFVSSARVFHWRNCWYPIALVEDLADGRPTGFSIHGERFVLFRDGEGMLGCLHDRCPHRAARLSDGQLVDGRLECLYHGWQFDGGGRCVSIPQLTHGSPIPPGACVPSYAVLERQGIAWVWPGDSSEMSPDSIPVIPALDRPGFTSIDFMMDLPYGQPYLVENVIDIAHIHIAHDGIRGGGKRELAAPLQFTVLENTMQGIRSTFASADDRGARGGPPLRGASVAFVAPNLVWYESDYVDASRASGLALYSLPLSASRCRLIYRAYSNFPRRRDRVLPRAVQHWTQCTILEQDMRVVMGQSEEIEGGNTALRDLWLPIKSSDALVIQYRKWLDEHGSSMPSGRGFTSLRPARVPAIEGETAGVDRFRLHTSICASCSHAHRVMERASEALAASMVVLLAAGVVWQTATFGVVSAAAAIAAGLGLVFVRAIKRRFE